MAGRRPQAILVCVPSDIFFHNAQQLCGNWNTRLFWGLQLQFGGAALSLAWVLMRIVWRPDNWALPTLVSNSQETPEYEKYVNQQIRLRNKEHIRIVLKVLIENLKFNYWMSPPWQTEVWAQPWIWNQNWVSQFDVFFCQLCFNWHKPRMYNDNSRRLRRNRVPSSHQGKLSPFWSRALQPPHTSSLFCGLASI